MTFRLLTYNIERGGHDRDGALPRVINACAPDLVLFQEATRSGTSSGSPKHDGDGRMARLGRQIAGVPEPRASRRHSGSGRGFSRHAFMEVVPRRSGPGLRRAPQRRARRRGPRSDGFSSCARCCAAWRTTSTSSTYCSETSTRWHRNGSTSALAVRLRALVWLSGGRIRWRTIQSPGRRLRRRLPIKHPDEPGCTLPTSNPHVRLDYVFVPQAEAGRLLTCDVVRVPAAIDASDHFPVVADFDVDPR